MIHILVRICGVQLPKLIIAYRTFVSRKYGLLVAEARGPARHRKHELAQALRAGKLLPR